MRTFCYLAVGLFALAIMADLVAKSKYSDAAVSVATANRSESGIATDRDLHTGKMFHVASYGLALLGIAFWITSGVRKERCFHVVLVVLLLLYVIAQLVFV